MKLIVKYCLVILLLPCLFTAGAQSAKLKKATKKYENFSYAQAIEVLSELVENDSSNKEVLTKLASSYYFNNEMKDASKWYGELFKLDGTRDGKEIDAEHIFQYAMALKGVEDYAASDKWMSIFKELQPEDIRAKRFIKNTDYRSQIETLTDGFIELKNLGINTEFSDFGARPMGDQVVFSSARGSKKKGVYKWNNQPYLDLYAVNKDKMGQAGSVSPFSSAINTQYHEASAAITESDRVLFFTRNNFYKNEYGKDGEGINRLQLFRAIKGTSTDWSDIKPVHFNSSEHSVAHPAVNAEGTRLYFASDMSGSIGESDLFVVDINADGSLGQPRNLGNIINTEGKESFPFINENGDLYYATKGIPGLGGYDIFVVRGMDEMLNTEGGLEALTEKDIKNVGKPINSSADDFAFYEDLQKKEGFFSSNRAGGKGDDDIYSFKRLECAQVVEGIVKAEGSDEPLSDATIILFDKEGKELERLVVGKDASFSFNLDCEKEYVAKVSKDEFNVGEIEFSTTKQVEMERGLELSLTKDKAAEEAKIAAAKAAEEAKEKAAKAAAIAKEKATNTIVRSTTNSGNTTTPSTTYSGTSSSTTYSGSTTTMGSSSVGSEVAGMSCEDLNSALEVPIVTFFQNSDVIKMREKPMLNRLIQNMLAYPSVNLEIRSHTDCTASAAYNLDLSRRRANATRDYLVSHGISSSRLTAIGLGESEPLSGCNCETKGSCTAADHARDRRSEFIISTVNGLTCKSFSSGR